MSLKELHAKMARFQWQRQHRELKHRITLEEAAVSFWTQAEQEAKPGKYRGFCKKQRKSAESDLKWAQHQFDKFVQSTKD